MSGKARGLSLRAKLALAFALVAALPLVGIEQVTSRIVRDRFADETRRAFEAALPPIERHFQLAAERVEARVEAAGSSYGLRDALLGWSRRPTPLGQKRLIDAIGASASATGLGLLTLYDDDGLVIASAQEPERFGVRDRAAVERFRAHPGRALLAREEGIAVSGLALAFARGIGDGFGDGGSRYWLAGGEVIDERSLPALPDSLALLVADGSGLRAAPTAAGAEALRLAASGGGGARQPGEALAAAGWQVHEVPLPDRVAPIGTRLTLATSRAPLLAELGQLERTFLALLGLGLLLASVLAVLIARRWTEPIEDLAAGLDRVARGDLDTRLASRRTDELGRLQSAFDAMTRDLADSREQLRRAERVAAWREIARRLAHEIKNPLTPIALEMAMLRRAYAARRPDFPDMLERSTEVVGEEVERLRRIVEEFSSFARLPPPRRIEASLHEVVREVVALYQGLERIRFVLDLAAGDARLAFDPDQLSRLLGNLVKNAIEAQPGGGEVRIATRPVDGGCVLEVRDGGPGVPLAMAGAVFEPYATSKEAEGGSGLGLAIAQGIAREHGGTLELVNPGEPGACFRLTLPAGIPVPGGEDAAAGGAGA